MEFLNAKLSERREALRTKFEEFTLKFISDWLDKVEAVERLDDTLFKFETTLKSTDKDRVAIGGVIYGRFIYIFHCNDFIDYINDLAKVLNEFLPVFYDDVTVLHSGNKIKILFSVPSSEEWLYDYIQEIVEYIIKEYRGYVCDISIPF